jgi:acyl-CoA synthetase (AMP-forming)/AMP-acid ligase II
MSDYLDRLLADPTSFHDAPYHLAFTLTRDEIDRLHLEGARRRFAELRPRLSVLDRLATDQGVDAIDTIDDLAPLLFPHTVYKSYPISYLERASFDKLTKWLAGLTTTDISHVDASGVESIDDWIDLLEAETDLMVQHTSGTTGKLSFVPRTKAQWRETIIHSAIIMRDWWGPGKGPDILRDGMPIIIPGYRYGAAATQRGNSIQVEIYAKGEENALFLYPDARFSADIASLGGRLRAAEARGEAGILDIPPVLLERREKLLELEKRRGADLEHFFAEAQRRFGGKDVYLTAMWAILYDWADEGLKRGFRNIFGPNSVLLTGGGKKGKEMPDNWRERVLEFLGFGNFYEMYATSELMGLCMMCEHGHYHVPPVIVPFLLDPATGRPLPRKDGTKGRMAMFDLMPNTYWAGLVTGDEITLSGWETPCACGRTGPHVIPPVRRYSEGEGGDDRIVCAGAPEAHDRALEFLAELSM